MLPGVTSARCGGPGGPRGGARGLGQKLFTSQFQGFISQTRLAVLGQTSQRWANPPGPTPGIRFCVTLPDFSGEFG